jgi:hypothetical protein
MNNTTSSKTYHKPSEVCKQQTPPRNLTPTKLLQFPTQQNTTIKFAHKAEIVVIFAVC